MLRSASLGIGFIFTGLLFAQPGLIRVNVDRVQVDAVVTDSSGRLVTDLNKGDFFVNEDGRRQSITDVTFVRTGGVAGAVVPERSRRNVPVKISDTKRVIALVVDDLGLSHQGMGNVRISLREFIDKKMEEGDLAALLRTGAGVGALQQFTTDRTSLRQAADSLRYNVASRQSVWSVGAPVTRLDRVVEGMVASAGGPGGGISTLVDANDEERDTIFGLGTLQSLQFIVEGMQRLPGRKSIVVFSENLKISKDARLRDALRKLLATANRASVVFYTIDPRNLIDQPLSLDVEEGLYSLAAETGGKFYRNVVDPAEPITSIMENQEGYYLVAYRPDPPPLDPQTRARINRKVTLTVSRPGLTVRFRNGAMGDSAIVPAQPVTRAEKLMAAVSSPFTATEIGVRVTALYSHASPGGAAAVSLLHMDARNLTFAKEPGGTQVAKIDLVAALFGDNSVMVDRIAKEFEIRLSDKAYALALQHGILYSFSQPLKKHGPMQMRVAVRDSASDRIGSATHFLDVPDFDSGNLIVSGISLQGTTEQGKEPDPGATPAVRNFRPGQKVFYTYQIFNAGADPEKKARLHVQTILRQDQEIIYTSAPEELAFPASSDPKHRESTGVFQLSPTARFGDYSIEVRVTDLNGKPRVATQISDFSVIDKVN